MDEAPKYPVQTVSNAIDILNCLSEDTGGRGVGITELSKQLGLGKSAVHRVLDTMLYYGFVDKNEETSRYRLGWNLYKLGQCVPRQNQLFTLEQGRLVELSKKTGETVNLAVLNRNETVLISKVEGQQAGARFSIQAGEHEAVHATALGKVLISEMSDAEVRALYGKKQKLQAYTEYTITSVEDLIAELAKVRSLGYAVDEQEYGIGFICMSCPVRDYSGKIIAGISVSTPSSRMTDEHRKEILDALQECCRDVSRTLGYR